MIKMICKNCGREIPEGKLYCDYCEFVLISGDRLFEKPDPNCENGNMGKTKNNLIVFFDKTDLLFQNEHIKKILREKAGANDNFLNSIQTIIYELLYHHFCEMVILNNTYSDNEIELFEEMVVLYTKFKHKDWINQFKENNTPISQFKISRNDIDLKLICGGIEKNPQYHMELIDNTDGVNYFLSQMLNVFAITAVYDKTCDFIGMADLYADILKGFTRVCPNISQKAVAFIERIVNVIKTRFNGHYSFMLENDFGEFVPTEEQKQTKALMDFSVAILEKYSKETAELALKLKAGYMIFGCFLVEKMTEMSTERYRILKYYFHDYFIESFRAREFHAVNILDYFEDCSNKLTDFYDKWPEFFNIFKQLDPITVESAGAPFSKVVHVVFARIQRHVVSAERMLSDKKVNDSIRFLNKANEITGEK